MASRNVGGTGYARCMGALFLATAALCGATVAQAAEAWPSRVKAHYKIELNGFDIGSFEFTAGVHGQAYTLTGDANLSALLGVLKWQGATRTGGRLAGDAPRPAGYMFDYAGAGKSGSIKMGFTGDKVTALSATPLQPAPAGTIPLTDTHLKGVLDPLSGVMALSRPGSGDPCARKLSIFDGKQRFDLLLSFSRQEILSATRPTGQPGLAFVCRVRYVPIAGHRVSEENEALAASAGIEISLRSIPSADLYVPHKITIPTALGSAVLTAQRVEITIRHNEQIALGD